MTPLAPPKYRTIVADPPWRYDEGFTVGVATGKDHRVIPTTGTRKSLRYDSMDMDEIAALPVAALAHPEGARVFLWTTSRYLREAFVVLDLWGFEYRQMLVWNKMNPSPFSGGVASSAAEFLMVAQRGAVAVTSKAQSSVLTLGVPKEHSRKPEAFLDLVEQVSPGPYLELFARRQRLGWDTWGNEALNHVELAS